MENIIMDEKNITNQFDSEAKIIDGKMISYKIKDELRSRIELLKTKKGRAPGLAVILVGNDSASAVYVRNKIKDCEEVGVKSIHVELPATASEDEVISAIEKLNLDDTVDGIILQLPLPKNLNEKNITKHISDTKDVDGFSAVSIGNLLLGNNTFVSCTPYGVMELLRRYGITVGGKNCVIIGRSNIVGKPMLHLLLRENGTVTICHSKTKNLADITSKADILVVAIGVAKFLKSDMVKHGAIVIDVGMNRDENGKLCGDVDFDEVKKVASYITPVPGGVGPMTRIMLISNTVDAAEAKLANDER